VKLDEAARAYLGVPWRHLGRSREGLDCIGLVLLAARDCGIDADDPAPYAREPSSQLLRQELARYLDPASIADPRPGDVLVFNLGLYAGHVGIAGKHPDYGCLSVIHAYAPRRCVVEECLGAEIETMTGVYRVRGGTGPHRACAMGAR
jgi:cell wall-associated NlpC family hydrolase